MAETAVYNPSLSPQALVLKLNERVARLGADDEPFSLDELEAAFNTSEYARFVDIYECAPSLTGVGTANARVSVTLKTDDDDDFLGLTGG